MRTKTLNSRLLTSLVVLLFVACQEKEGIDPASPTDYRLTSVWAADADGKEQLLLWRATYYPDGKLKDVSDNRDSTYVSYAYYDQEIRVSDIQAHQHWPPFTYFTLLLNEKKQVSEAYFGQENGSFNVRRYDTTTFSYDQLGFMVEQTQKSTHIHPDGSHYFHSSTLLNQVTDGNIVTSSVSVVDPSGYQHLSSHQLVWEFYADQEDKNSIQACYGLYLSYPKAIPFTRPSAKLPRKVSYVSADGGIGTVSEFTYQSDPQGNVKRIAEKRTDGSAYETMLYYSLKYNE